MSAPTFAPSVATEVTHDVSGKVCLVTGATSGIGLVTALELARAGGHVFLACRNLEAARGIVEGIKGATGNPNVELLQLDLMSLASVRACAEAFIARGLPLHILVNNAGVAGGRELTADGFEQAIGVNHIGHFLLTQLLLPTLKASAPARVVIVASQAHKRIKAVDLDQATRPTKSRTAFREYAISKAMNMLYARSLGRHLAGTGVTTYSLHPGVVASSIWRRVPQPFRWLMTRTMITNEQGARTQLWCATAPELSDQTGLYYDQCAEAQPHPPLDTDAQCDELWARSLGWAGLPAE